MAFVDEDARRNETRGARFEPWLVVKVESAYRNLNFSC